jgi:hypothetical protein
MAKPGGSLPSWNTGLANQAEPSGAKKILGWETSEAPPSGYFNWLQWKYGEWIAYLNDTTALAFDLAGEVWVWTAAACGFEKGLLVTQDEADTDALTATGNGTGYGIKAKGGTGGRFERNDADTSKNAITVVGLIDANGATMPANTTALTGQITPLSYPKVAVSIQSDGLGGLEVAGESLNVASIGVGGGAGNPELTVTFASNFAGSNYIVQCLAQYTDGDLLPLMPVVQTKNVGSVVMRFVYNTLGTFAPQDLLVAADVKIYLAIYGVQ